MAMRVSARAVAGDDGVDMGAPGAGAGLIFQYEKHGCLAEDEPPAVRIEGTACLRRIVATRGEQAQRLPGLERAVGERRFGSPDQRHLVVAMPDTSQGLADSDGR